MNSQDIGETKPETAKPACDLQANENPGALAGASGVKIDHEAAKLPPVDSPDWAGAPAIIARHFCGVAT